MHKLQISRLQKIKDLLVNEYKLNKKTGEIRTKEDRPVYIDTENQLQLYCKETKKSYKVLSGNASYFLYTGKYPNKDEVILFKNLDQKDVSPCNLQIIKRFLYKEIHTAYRNVDGEIKITTHSDDKFMVVLHWLEVGKRRQKVFYDYEVADKMKKQLIINNIKLLTKYCVFD